MKVLSVINSIRFRKWMYQLVLVVLLLALVTFLVTNAISALQRQGIISGFDFLTLSTGFDIASSFIPYDSSSSYLRLFFAALVNTLVVSVVSIVLATIIGFFVGIMRVSNHPVVSRCAAGYIELIRNIPLLLQVLFWYFAVLQTLPAPKYSIEFFHHVFINNRGIYMPSFNFSGNDAWFFLVLFLSFFAIIYVFNAARHYRVSTGCVKPLWWWAINMGSLLLFLLVASLFLKIDVHVSLPQLRGFNFDGGLVISPEFLALLLGLSLYTGAYIAENVRSGLQSVKKGQIEAGMSIGLTRSQIIRLIVMPNAMRVIVPPLTNQYLNLTKNSSLAAAIAYPDIVLVFAGTAMNQTAQAIEILFMVMLVYLFISLIISLLMNWYNSKIKITEH